MFSMSRNSYPQFSSFKLPFLVVFGVAEEFLEIFGLYGELDIVLFSLGDLPLIVIAINEYLA